MHSKIISCKCLILTPLCASSNPGDPTDRPRTRGGRPRERPIPEAGLLRRGVHLRVVEGVMGASPRPGMTRAEERLARVAQGICRTAHAALTTASGHHDSATPTNPELVTVHSVHGSTLDRQTAGRVQEILQRSFHGNPDRKGYYIPLPEELLLKGTEKDEAVDRLLAQATRRRELWHLAFDKTDGALAAIATTFEHTIRLADGSCRQILALGEVATHPDYRGRGHGAAAVRVAFSQVSVAEGARDVMLWQTGEAQGMYEKLGARVVPTANIVNSAAASHAEDGCPVRAFWDLVAMIYPSDAAWDDDDVVDLMAPGW